MTVQEYIQLLRERWLAIFISIIAALLAAAATWSLKPATFTANLTFYVAAQTADTTATAYQGAQLSQERVTSYVELVKSQRVAEAVTSDLKLGVSASDLVKEISASSATDSVLINVSVTDESPQRASDIANSLGSVFTSLIEELERPIVPGGVPSVAVRVVQPAAVPAVPSSTGLALTLALGLIAGVVVGIGGALARHTLDTSVKSPERLRLASGAPNLGSIAFDPVVPKRPLTLHEDPHSPRSEAFRQIRTNLQFIDVDNPRKVIAVTSSMPSEGKTTTVANLAIALASAGLRVIALEADMRRPKLANLLGIDGSVGLTSILASRVSIQQAVQQWGGGAFDVITSGPLPPNPSELLASKHMLSVIEELRISYDIVLIDCPPLLPVTDAAAISPATDGVLLICRYKQTKRDQVEAACQAIESVSSVLLGTVFTMVPSSGPQAYAKYNSYYQTEVSETAERPIKQRDNVRGRAQVKTGNTPSGSDQSVPGWRR